MHRDLNVSTDHVWYMALLLQTGCGASGHLSIIIASVVGETDLMKPLLNTDN